MTNAAQIATTLGWAALVAYSLSAILYTTSLFRTHPAIGRSATAFAIAGALCNFGTLYSRSVALHSVPYRDLLGSMKLFGFFLAILNIVLEFRHKDRSLGPFLMPAALAFLLLSVSLTAPVHADAPELKGPVFALHVTLNMLAYAAFAVACALSLLYLWVGRSLKKRAFSGPASRLPSLSYLERANRTSLSLGVLTLSIGLFLGLFWASRMWKGEHPLWALDPKIWFALATLAFYIFVVVRARRGAAPVSTARLSVAGFLLVLLSYTAVNVFASKLHDFTS
ncbi:MAG TPA: cytochrome c biogenesis protein CcsA [Thermoanaerobaculia bacterium]